MRKLTAEERKKSRGVRIPGTDAELDFIIDNTPDTQQRFDVLMALAKRNAAQKATQDAFYAEYRRLTAGLSATNEMALAVGLPMKCNADSTDVEVFIVEHYKQAVNDENFVQVGHEFKRWFRETAPHEYATEETERFNPWRRASAPPPAYPPPSGFADQLLRTAKAEYESRATVRSDASFAKTGGQKGEIAY